MQEREVWVPHVLRLPPGRRESGLCGRCGRDEDLLDELVLVRGRLQEEGFEQIERMMKLCGSCGEWWRTAV
jgi:hypothetical protein